jgi:tRNA(fMet)-specific endonuclease VapC
VSLLILDTDHISLLLWGHPEIESRISQSNPRIVTTIITVQELFNGWVSVLNNEPNSTDLVPSYTRFWNTVELIRRLPVLNFDADAHYCYSQILQVNPELRKKVSVMNYSRR